MGLGFFLLVVLSLFFFFFGGGGGGAGGVLWCFVGDRVSVWGFGCRDKGLGVFFGLRLGFRGFRVFWDAALGLLRKAAGTISCSTATNRSYDAKSKTITRSLTSKTLSSSAPVWTF